MIKKASIKRKEQITTKEVALNFELTTFQVHKQSRQSPPKRLETKQRSASRNSQRNSIPSVPLLLHCPGAVSSTNVLSESLMVYQ